MARIMSSYALSSSRGLLFLCVANSARSQLAEALARHRFGSRIRVQSAGTQPSQINPAAVAVLAEQGISAADQYSKSVETIDAKTVGLVITLCAEEVCPIAFSAVPHLHWPIPDPASPAGHTPPLSLDELLPRFRQARDTIAARLATLSVETP